MTSTFTEDLDDYEQKLLKFTGSVQSNLDALLRLLDNAKIDPSDNDKLMNLAIGLSQYVDTMTDDLCEDLENHIKKGDFSGEIHLFHRNRQRLHDHFTA
jgi:hypothetical protein